ncbi:hypothetical protein [Iningainema tapete]|uniref:Uncharacterized protein n=1 Tax=Iningainema tapete BLCC-T55 TaxID=2748662 RepID=A0A8J7C9V2_9CYAN|nr:hypothetical protein [Iningainema tapete]MBD2776401.1 hypothetical protein [Iningainema tapete BLCC-T55]
MNEIPSSKYFGIFLMDFINAIRDKNLEWYEKTADRTKALKEKNELSSVQIEQAIKKSVQDFEQEIALKKITYDQQMENAKLKAKKTMQKYEKFLEEIDELRNRIQEFYPNMPLPLVSLIHHHASQLLDEMWQASENKRELNCKKEFIQFLTVVYEDTDPTALKGNPRLPLRILKYIEESK